ncbi:DinB family protein [Blastopirellula marina]|uniref:Damage-inducible protein DinB n=1 Tax=Blastopirellula marina TaxID=124 RepID=A0A2S8G119_9BACT|nr:DinB family protein [Blastopirellula marina]PQO38126.1 damage-inducible protein DinB [Blastopirellula marina]PTL44782.1 DinB family protein [Blastopirellula marina]
MSLSEMIFGDFEQEMASTRKCLERVPNDKWDWKIHEKSNTIGWVAGHLAEIPSWAVSALRHDSFDICPPDAPPVQPTRPAKIEEALEIFDKNVAEAREALAAVKDEDLTLPWSLLNGGQVLFTMPKVAVVRTWVINHTVHHRAILTVYFRMNEVPVPALYGPSADEQA